MSQRSADQIRAWGDYFSPSDWPEGTLHQMSAELITCGVFPLRDMSGVPMWPSSLAEAHVRMSGRSRHSTNYGARLSDATDMHVKTVAHMLVVMGVASRMQMIGGIGIYFDTNTPMFHIDMRFERVTWLRTKAGAYVYCDKKDPGEFYKVLAEEILNAVACQTE